MFLCLIFHETFLPINMELLLMAKITTEVNNYLLLVHAMQILRSSLQARCGFWRLIMVSTKVCSMYMSSHFCKHISKGM